jgi:lysophospholipase L1-like esterase
MTAQLRQQGIDIVPFVEAEEGSGYVATGKYEGSVFADQIPKVVRPDDRIVVIFGSSNDTDVPAEELQPAVNQTLHAVRAAAPQAKLIVIGPTWPDSDPPSGVLQARDLIRTEAGTMGADFVDPLADKWFSDQPGLIASDGIHPTDDGHAYMAGKIAPLIAQQLEVP